VPQVTSAKADTCSNIGIFYATLRCSPVAVSNPLDYSFSCPSQNLSASGTYTRDCVVVGGAGSMKTTCAGTTVYGDTTCSNAVSTNSLGGTSNCSAGATFTCGGNTYFISIGLLALLCLVLALLQ
jgi:hypothetical protein